LPFLTALCRPAEKHSRRRHKTSIDWVRQMMQQVRRWLPGRRLVLVVDGGFAAVLLALACVKSRVVMVSRLRWDAAPYHPPGWQPQGKRGPKPTKGKRQRRLQSWAERFDTPWESVEVAWYGVQRKQLWVFSRTALWYTPRVPLVAIRDVLVADPEGKLRMEACCCTDRQATPEQILAWVVRRWSVEVTFEEVRAHLGLETQRQWSALAIARTTPVLLGLFSRVTLLALKWSDGGQIPVPVTAWYHKDEPTCSDCLAVVRRHLGGHGIR
jgi:DDE superfamily endonuclease